MACEARTLDALRHYKDALSGEWVNFCFLFNIEARLFKSIVTFDLMPRPHIGVTR
jgi:hypothetical protein